jgi:hypothetical protein
MNNAAVLIENCDVDILVVRLKQPLDSSNQTNLSATKCLTTNFSTIRSCNINPVKPEITLLDAIMKSLEVVQNSLDPCDVKRQLLVSLSKGTIQNCGDYSMC